jgi:hypothetical protein
MTLLWIWEMISYVNSSFNVIIYYVMGTRYRQTLHALLRGACRRCGIGALKNISIEVPHSCRPTLRGDRQEEVGNPCEQDHDTVHAPVATTTSV